MSRSLRVGALPALLCAAACGQPLAPDTTSGFFRCADHPGMAAAAGEVPAPIDFRSCFVRNRESAGANWVADGIWWALQGGHFSSALTDQIRAAHARFYLSNTGALQLKTTLPAGELCQTGYLSNTPPGSGNLAAGGSMVDALVPFHDPQVLVTMKTSLLAQVLERQFAQAVNPKGVALSFPNADGSLLLYSGNLRLTVDFTDYQNRSQLFVYPSTVRPGQLIVRATLDGAPLDLTSDAPITFVAENFVAGVDVAGGQIQGRPGAGAGVRSGFFSDAFAADGNQFVLLDAGRDPALPDTLTETHALARYLAAFPTVAPQVDGRMQLLSLTGPQAVDLCQ